RHLPTASKFSKAVPSGSISRWHEAQAGSARCFARRCGTVSGFFSSFCSTSSLFTSAGGGGGGVFRIVSSTHLPRCTGLVRAGRDAPVSPAPIVSTPPRLRSVHLTRYHGGWALPGGFLPGNLSKP